MFAEFNKPIEVARQLPGTHIKGEWHEGQSFCFTIQTSVQPSDSRVVHRIIMGSEWEGRRLPMAYTLFTATELRYQDRPTIDNDIYEVVHVEPWQNGVVPHYMAIALKMQKESEL